MNDSAAYRLRALADGAKPPLPVTPRPIVSIGAGSIVQHAHLPAYRKAGFPVAAITDADSGKAAAMAKQFGIPAVESIQAGLQLAGSHVVFDLAVPAGSILRVLPNIPDGAAVLIQKPMGETLQEAALILRLCREKALTAAVNFQLRYAPAMLAARRIMEHGLLGDVCDMQVHVNVFTPWDLWRFLATAPRLEILYHSIHYLDLARSFFGNPRKVLARTVRNPHTPSLAATRSVIVLDYGDWKRVYIATNHHHNFPQSQESYVQWEGTRGMLRAVMGVNLDYPAGRPDSLQFAAEGQPWETVPISGNWFPDAFIGSMGSLQAHISGCAGTLPTSAEDAFDTMRTVEAAYLSSEQDGTDLPDPGGA